MPIPLEFCAVIDDILARVSEYALAAQLFAMLAAAALAHYAGRRVLRHLRRRSEATRNRYDDALVTAIGKPFAWFVWVLGASWVLELADSGLETGLVGEVRRLRDVAVIWVLAWFAVRFIRQVEAQVILGTPGEGHMDVTTAAAIAKILRIVVLAVALLLAMQAFGFSIASVLAFGGLGGLAVGFAARDLLANFFGALMIFVDRPFSVGDWIRSPDQEIEGTVEDIGWRLTRIRTFDQRPLYIPNATFAKLTVENPSKMLNRRIYETIGLRYDDLAVLPAIVADVENMLREHPDIDGERTLMVNFVTFGASSLDFFVYTFTKTTDWQTFHAVKQDVLFKIGEIIQRHGAEIAFPTQVMHLTGPTS